MTTPARCETSFNALLEESLISERPEWMSDPPPRDGIRFARGVFLGMAICTPFWLLVFWVITGRF